MKIKILFYTGILLLIWLFAGCEDAFDFSPYAAKPNPQILATHKSNIEQFEAIEERDYPQATFRFAIVSDNHSYLDDLAQAVKLINSDTTILFVIHAGDMADGGMLHEYELFHRTMSRLNVPWFTVIGNHDVLANGRAIYNQVFGEENYVLDFSNNKFIFFNNVLLELTPEIPDFNWLEEQLIKSKHYENTFVIAHIPPWDDTYTQEVSSQFTKLLKKYGVRIAIHGHHHNPFEQTTGDLTYLVTGAPQRGVFRTIDVQGQNISINTVQLNPQP